jgi:hypothetical protein
MAGRAALRRLRHAATRLAGARDRCASLLHRGSTASSSLTASLRRRLRRAPFAATGSTRPGHLPPRRPTTHAAPPRHQRPAARAPPPPRRAPRRHDLPLQQREMQSPPRQRAAFFLDAASSASGARHDVHLHLARQAWGAPTAARFPLQPGVTDGPVPRAARGRGLLPLRLDTVGACLLRLHHGGPSMRLLIFAGRGRGSLSTGGSTASARTTGRAEPRRCRETPPDNAVPRLHQPRQVTPDSYLATSAGGWQRQPRLLFLCLCTTVGAEPTVSTSSSHTCNRWHGDPLLHMDARRPRTMAPPFRRLATPRRSLSASGSGSRTASSSSPGATPFLFTTTQRSYGHPWAQYSGGY